MEISTEKKPRPKVLTLKKSQSIKARTFICGKEFKQQSNSTSHKNKNKSISNQSTVVKDILIISV